MKSRAIQHAACLSVLFATGCSLSMVSTKTTVNRYQEPVGSPGLESEEEVSLLEPEFSVAAANDAIEASATQWAECTTFRTISTQKYATNTRTLHSKQSPLLLLVADLVVGAGLVAPGAYFLASASGRSESQRFNNDGTESTLTKRSEAYLWGGTLAALGIVPLVAGIYRSLTTIDTTGKVGEPFSVRQELKGPHQCNARSLAGQPVSVKIGGELVQARLDASGKAVLALPVKEVLIREVGDSPAVPPIVVVRFSPPGTGEMNRQVDLRELPAFVKVATEHLTEILEKKTGERDYRADKTCGLWAAIYSGLECDRYQHAVAGWEAKDAAEAEEKRAAELKQRIESAVGSLSNRIPPVINVLKGCQVKSSYTDRERKAIREFNEAVKTLEEDGDPDFTNTVVDTALERFAASGDTTERLRQAIERCDSRVSEWTRTVERADEIRPLFGPFIRIVGRCKKKQFSDADLSTADDFWRALGALRDEELQAKVWFVLAKALKGKPEKHFARARACADRMVAYAERIKAQEAAEARRMLMTRGNCIMYGCEDELGLGMKLTCHLGLILNVTSELVEVEFQGKVQRYPKGEGIASLWHRINESSFHIGRRMNIPPGSIHGPCP